MRNLNKSLLALSVGLGVVLMTLPVSASADKVTKRIESKTKKAMEEYDIMEFEAAKALLVEAITVGEKSSATGGELAAAYLNLGIVYFSGLGEEASASEAFKKAVAIDSEVKLGVAYSTPEMSALLEAARAGGAANDNCSVSGIAHELVDEAPTGSKPEIRATMGSGVQASEMKMYYRGEGQLEFNEVPMQKDGACDYVAHIPIQAVQGDFVHYYIAALDGEGKELERKGSSGSPNIIEVAAASGGSITSDENPLDSDTGKSVLLPEKGSRIFLSIGVGTGSGYINGPTEKTKSMVREGSNFAPAWLHLLPELGYYFNRQLSLAAAFRMGFPIGANVEGHATFAPAGLLRVRYALNASGEGIQFSGSLGGGVIRNTVQIQDAAEEMDTDTTVMGPLLFGGGLGYSKSLGGPMRLVAELGALAAVTAGFEELGTCPGDGCVRPKNGAQFDANLALLFAF